MTNNYINDAQIISHYGNVDFKNMIYHYSLILIGNIKETDHTDCWQDCRANKTTVLLLGRQHDAPL